MVEQVRSADGTVIAFDRSGSGPPVVVLGGIFCTRATTADLAAALADRGCTVLNVDRRGRGDSGGASQSAGPDAVEREVEDVAAVLAAAGAPAALYGHSSGAGLAAHVAAAGIPVRRLVLHEPPYGGDDEVSTTEARAMAADILHALDEGRPGDAIRRFFADMGMPADVVDGMAADPSMLAVAPTMRHDIAVMDEAETGGVVPVDLIRSIAVPTLVVAGGASPDFFRTAADRLVELLPDASLAVLPGADHGAPADVVAPVVAALLEQG
jgi:pimeloyl-ACP methyl ester carboxylesterase